MKLKGLFKQKYILDKETKELVVEVVLKQVDGLLKPRQNVWYGIATANDKEIKHKGLENCVDAQVMADDIGCEIIEAWKKRAKREGKIFKPKHNENKSTKNEKRTKRVRSH